MAMAARSGTGVDAYLVPSSHRLERMRDPSALTPEQLLEALFEPLDEETVRRSPKRQRDALAQGLELLPPFEREAIEACLLGATQQSELAKRRGVTQQAISLRVSSGMRRLRWLLGPASWYGEEDLRRDLAGVLSTEEIEALVIYWHTTSPSGVRRKLGMSRDRAYGLLRRAIKRLKGRYRKGFELLLSYIRRNGRGPLEFRVPGLGSEVRLHAWKAAARKEGLMVYVVEGRKNGQRWAAGFRFQGPIEHDRLVVKLGGWVLRQLAIIQSTPGLELVGFTCDGNAWQPETDARIGLHVGPLIERMRKGERLKDMLEGRR